MYYHRKIGLNYGSFEKRKVFMNLFLTETVTASHMQPRNMDVLLHHRRGRGVRLCDHLFTQSITEKLCPSPGSSTSIEGTESLTQGI